MHANQRLRSLPLPSLALLTLVAGCSSGGGGGVTTGSSVGTIINSPTAVSGADVTLQGPGGTFTTTSSSNGTFRVDGIPAGTYSVEVNGGGVFDANGDPIADKIDIDFPSVTIGAGDNVLGGKAVFLPTKAQGTTVDTSGGNAAVLAAGTVIANETAGVSLQFDTATTVTFADSTDTTLSINLLPAEQTPFPLPDAVTSAQVVVVLPLGATFSTPPSVSFSNWNSLPSGASNVPLYTFDEADAAWEQFGTGRVSSDGQTVVSDAGQGPSGTGWFTPVASTFCTTTVTGSVEDGSNNGIAGALVTTVNGETATTDATGAFTITGVPLSGSGASVLATAVPGANSGFSPNESGTVLGVCGGTTDVGTIVLAALAVDTTAPTVASTTPAADATGVLDNVSISVTFSERMSPGSLLDGGLTLVTGTTEVAGAIALSVSGGQTTATFVPDALLAVDSTYSLTISGSAFDDAGNGLGDDVEVTFSTAGASSGGAAAVDATPDGPIALDPGATQQLTAAATDASGSAAAGAVVLWSSSDPNVASVDSTGLVTALTPGSATITATFGGATDTEVINVNTPAIASVVVAPATLDLAVGAIAGLQSEARDAGSNALSGFAFEWSSSNTSVATVDAGGNVTAVGSGTATITATEPNSTLSGAATVEVVDLTAITTVAVTPATLAVAVGSSTQLAATASDVGGDPVPGVNFTWTSSDTSVATVSATGVVTGVGEGPVSITAEAEGSGNVTDTTAATIFIDADLVITVYDRRTPDTPIQGATVVRHDPTDGSFVEELTTDASGMADFGMIGAPRTSITVVLTDPKSTQTAQLMTLMDVPVGCHGVTIDRPGNDALISVNLTGIEANDNIGHVFTSGFEPGDAFSAFVQPTFGTISGVTIDQFQTGGNASLIVTSGDQVTATPSAAAFALDFDPFVAGEIGVDAALQTSAITTIPFTSKTPIAPAGGLVRRSGVIFDLDFGDAPEIAGGNTSLAIPTGADRIAYRFETGGDASQPTESMRQLTFDASPSTIAPVLPDVAIATLTRDSGAQSTSLTTSGTDSVGLDLGVLEYDYEDGSLYTVHWAILFDPSTSTVEVPSLGSSMSGLMPPMTGVSYSLETIEAEGVSSFDGLLELVKPFQGDVEQLALDSRLDLGTASRTIHPIGFSVTGSGTATMTIDDGNGPVAVDLANELEYDEGTTVTVTVTADSGFMITGLTSPDATPTGVPGTSASCTFELGAASTVQATVAPLP